MPRLTRLHVPGGIYHVILRGNHRQPIFYASTDRDYLGALVGEIMERLQMRVHAYCWMTNHIHAAIQVGDVPLGAAMSRIAARYARYAQRRKATTGHLFERRYRAILIDADAYLLALVRYIHLNPVRAQMVSDPKDYPWSGHRAYLGLADTPWLTTEFTLQMFSRDLGKARDVYRRFILQTDGVESDECFRNGGEEDRRILGDNRRFSQIVPPGEKRERSFSLDALIEEVCATFGIRAEDLAAAGRLRRPAQARSVILWHARQSRLATLTDLARRFGRAPSTLCETLELYQRTQPQLFAIDFTDGK